MKVVHYCCGKYPNSFGGVARFDYHVSLAFPDRVWFLGVVASQGKAQKEEMLKYLAANKGNVVVLTDNHLACDIPPEYPLIIVHHGCAKTTVARTPALAKMAIYQEIVEGQTKMLKLRNPNNTMMLSCSRDCIDSFTQFYGEQYTKFFGKLLLHSSELTQQPHQLRTAGKPRVLGNFMHPKKGKDTINSLIEMLKDEFEFVTLKTQQNTNIQEHNKEIANIYKSCDIFLQLATSEGNSYATLDGFVHNLLICGTNTGLLYDLQNTDVGVIFDWTKMTDIAFVANQIRFLWANRTKYHGKSGEWFVKNCDFETWKKNLRCIVSDFFETHK